jgi:phenylacetate-coenzyme A ligase PaaK-like adenylate-forming protein
MKPRIPAPPRRDRALAPLEATLEFWNYCANLGEIWWGRYGALPAGDVAGARLQALVRFARAHSPYFHRLYAHLPASGVTLRDLPIVTKADLMANFDGWVTDPLVRLAELRRFLADRSRVGEAFQGRYRVWTSSGTTGTPGIFLQDSHALSVYEALVAAQFNADELVGLGPARLAAGGGRAALVSATGDHFASVTFWERRRRDYPGIDSRSFSVLAPIKELVSQLNDYQPAYVASYPSVLALLAGERETGRLKISPAQLWSGGEFMADSTRDAIESAFECRVKNEYGSSECLSMAHACREGWMHVNSEWVILEGADKNGQPTEPGEVSHTVLVTNLANWLQPIIRYDLGDRVMALPSACACGNPRPAFHVEGRKDDLVALRTSRGRTVRLAPLALSTAVEDAAGPRRFQIAQTAPEQLLVRLEREGDDDDRQAAWRKTSKALRAYLAKQSLPNVRLALDREPPRIDERSGKLRSVIVEL